MLLVYGRIIHIGMFQTVAWLVTLDEEFQIHNHNRGYTPTTHNAVKGKGLGCTCIKAQE